MKLNVVLFVAALQSYVSCISLFSKLFGKSSKDKKNDNPTLMKSDQTKNESSFFNKIHKNYKIYKSSKDKKKVKQNLMKNDKTKNKNKISESEAEFLSLFKSGKMEELREKYKRFKDFTPFKAVLETLKNEKKCNFLEIVVKMIQGGKFVENVVIFNQIIADVFGEPPSKNKLLEVELVNQVNKHVRNKISIDINEGPPYNKFEAAVFRKWLKEYIAFPISTEHVKLNDDLFKDLSNEDIENYMKLSAIVDKRKLVLNLPINTLKGMKNYPEVALYKKNIEIYSEIRVCIVSIQNSSNNQSLFADSVLCMLYREKNLEFFNEIVLMLLSICGKDLALIKKTLNNDMPNKISTAIFSHLPELGKSEAFWAFLGDCAELSAENINQFIEYVLTLETVEELEMVYEAMESFNANVYKNSILPGFIQGMVSNKFEYSKLKDHFFKIIHFNNRNILFLARLIKNNFFDDQCQVENLLNSNIYLKSFTEKIIVDDLRFYFNRIESVIIPVLSYLKEKPSLKQRYSFMLQNFIKLIVHFKAEKDEILKALNSLLDDLQVNKEIGKLLAMVLENTIKSPQVNLVGLNLCYSIIKKIEINNVEILFTMYEKTLLLKKELLDSDDLFVKFQFCTLDRQVILPLLKKLKDETVYYKKLLGVVNREYLKLSVLMYYGLKEGDCGNLTILNDDMTNRINFLNQNIQKKVNIFKDDIQKEIFLNSQFSNLFTYLLELDHYEPLIFSYFKVNFKEKSDELFKAHLNNKYKTDNAKKVLEIICSEGQNVLTIHKEINTPEIRRHFNIVLLILEKYKLESPIYEKLFTNYKIHSIFFGLYSNSKVDDSTIEMIFALMTRKIAEFKLSNCLDLISNDLKNYPDFSKILQKTLSTIKQTIEKPKDVNNFEQVEKKIDEIFGSVKNIFNQDQSNDQPSINIEKPKEVFNKDQSNDQPSINNFEHSKRSNNQPLKLSKAQPSNQSKCQPAKPPSKNQPSNPSKQPENEDLLDSLKNGFANFFL